MAEESGEWGMNCLAIEVAIHPATHRTTESKNVIWKRLEELETVEKKIKPDYNKVIHGWQSH